ncbi:MAG: NAD(P)/FAD-dependent oxidoreductase, partial [Lachnospiraceae bacterium]
VRLDAKVTLAMEGKETVCERGELQFTDYGISGIVVFQFSRLAAYELLHKKMPKVYIDCLPDFSGEEYRLFADQRKRDRQAAETVEEFFTGMVNKKLLLLFLKLADLKPGDAYRGADKGKIDKVFALCKSFPLTISGCNSFDAAQVCAGGIPLREVSANLESLFVRGLYLAGELLDVDGKCGGYNLQWAWASGYVAGKNAAVADKLKDRKA